jgi:hypothetical protein
LWIIIIFLAFREQLTRQLQAEDILQKKRYSNKYFSIVFSRLVDMSQPIFSCYKLQTSPFCTLFYLLLLPFDFCRFSPLLFFILVLYFFYSIHRPFISASSSYYLPLTVQQTAISGQWLQPWEWFLIVIWIMFTWGITQEVRNKKFHPDPLPPPPPPPIMQG